MQARRWVANRLGEQRLAFLATLPLDLTLELDGLGSVRVFPVRFGAVLAELSRSDSSERTPAWR